MRNENNPMARTEGIVIQTLGDETLVYDLNRHRAHCLNHMAALVWERCDGRASVEEIAASIRQELGTPVDEGVVWLALDQLSGADLLAAPNRRAGGRRLSRRELVRRLGVAASLPLVSTITAPPAQAAASCINNAQGCMPFGAGCSSNLQCCSCSCQGGTCQ